MRGVTKIGLALVMALSLSFASVAARGESINLPANSTGEQIQAALDRLPASGGEVVLPAGKFIVHRPIILQRDHLTLRGAGLDTTLFLADNANCPVVVLGMATHPVNDVRLESLYIDGNRAHQSVELWKKVADGSLVNNNGVEVHGTVGAVVQAVVSAHCRSGGLVTAAINRRLTVRNFTSFDNQFDGLACYLTEDSQFSDLLLHDNLGAGISLDLDFNHNTVRDAVLTNNDLGIFMRQSFSNSFAGLTIQHSHHDGVFMAQSGGEINGAWAAFPGTACIGNTFTNLSISNSGDKAFVINDPSCTNNSLLDCRYTANAHGDLFQTERQPQPMIGAILKH